MLHLAILPRQHFVRRLLSNGWKGEKSMGDVAEYEDDLADVIEKHRLKGLSVGDLITGLETQKMILEEAGDDEGEEVNGV